MHIIHLGQIRLQDHEGKSVDLFQTLQWTVNVPFKKNDQGAIEIEDEVWDNIMKFVQMHGGYAGLSLREYLDKLYAPDDPA